MRSDRSCGCGHLQFVSILVDFTAAGTEGRPRAVLVAVKSIQEMSASLVIFAGNI